MPETAPSPVLARKIAAHLGMGGKAPDPTPDLQSGLTRAIRRASIPFDGLSARPAEVSVTCATTLSASMEHLPASGLLAALEDAEGRRGLVAVAHPLVDALIEVQTTGKVEEAELPARSVTRIDESLCREFLDMLLAAFSVETAKATGNDWPDRISYGSRIADRGQLNLLLPETLYHRLEVEVTVGASRKGALLLLLPCDPTLARRRAAGADTPAAARPGNWGQKVLAALGPAPMTLDAVLLRVTMPLGRVEALVEGDLIPFDRADLGAVSLEGEGGHIFFRGALGQLGGRRAVRPSLPAAPVAPKTPDRGLAGPAPAGSVPPAAPAPQQGLVAAPGTPATTQAGRSAKPAGGAAASSDADGQAGLPGLPGISALSGMADLMQDLDEQGARGS